MANDNGVANIYKIKQKISDLRNEPNTSNYCNICFERDCTEHNQGTCNRKDAVDALTWWLGIAIQEADVLLLGENEDIIVPKFPNGNGKRIEYRKYDHVPVLSNLVFIYVGDNQQLYTENGNLIGDLDLDINSPGIYWGYIWNDEFYLLTTFDNGEFYNSRQQLPTAGEIPIEAVEGFWHIPKGRMSYREFAGGLLKT